MQVLVKEETAELEGAGFDAGVSGSADVAVSSGTSGPWKQEKLKSIISRILWQPDKVILVVIGCWCLCTSSGQQLQVLKLQVVTKNGKK